MRAGPLAVILAAEPLPPPLAPLPLLVPLAPLVPAAPPLPVPPVPEALLPLPLPPLPPPRPPLPPLLLPDRLPKDESIPNNSVLNNMEYVCAPSLEPSEEEELSVLPVPVDAAAPAEPVAFPVEFAFRFSPPLGSNPLLPLTPMV